MPSRRLVSFCAIDWLVIVAAIVISLLLAKVNPDLHTFCLLDMSLSHPRRTAKVSLPLFIVLSSVLPIVVITGVCILVPLQQRQSSRNSRHLVNKLKALNHALLGLGVSLGSATVVFTGVKNLTGKPRPDMLSICDPDLSQVEKYAVGGFGAEVSRLLVMVDINICKYGDKAVLRDEFRSFPSGYSTVAFAGLWYLSLFLCHWFAVVFPPSNFRPKAPSETRDVDSDEQANPLLSDTDAPDRGRDAPVDAGEQAAFPVYKLLLPYVPLGLAIFLAGTRYFDFRNHGFDVLAGAAIGSITAWTGFRMYHSPLLSG